MNRLKCFSCAVSLASLFLSKGDLFAQDRISIRSEGDRVRVSIILDREQSGLVRDASGQSTIRIDLQNSGVIGELGRPSLPMRTILLPLDNTVRSVNVTSLQSERELVPNVTVPVVIERDSAGRALDGLWREDDASLYPASLVQVAEIARTPAGRVAKIVYFPVQVLPSRDAVYSVRSITCTLHLVSAGTSLEDLRAIHKVPSVAASSPSPVIRIGVAADGPVHLRIADLRLLGLTESTIDRLLLTLRGQMIPLMVRQSFPGNLNDSDEVIFWGQRNYVQPRTLSQYSDTSIYLLSLGTGAGLRYIPLTQAVAQPETLVSAHDTVRFKQEKLYHPGNGALTSQNLSELVPGEGWYWARIQGGQQASLSFPGTGQTGIPLDSVTIAVRLQGTTTHVSSPDHVINLSLNGVPLGTVSFDGYLDTIASFRIPAALLNSVENQIIVRNTNPNFNEVLVDYVEFRQTKLLAASANLLQFIAEPSGGPARTFHVTGFTDSVVTVLRVGSFPASLHTDVRSTGNGSFEVWFADSATGTQQYVVFGRSALQPAGFMLARTPLDPLTQALNTDYLIIAHPSLLGSAERLASYRRLHDSLSTAVVSVEDVYDRYGDGFAEPEAIKSFLRDWYDKSVSRKPVYLLLFGDASWDYKNRLGGNRRTLIPSWGFPAADAWFSGFDSDNVFLPFLHTGRLPAQTPAEAGSLVDKIIQYDTGQLSPWNKRYMMLTAGITDAEAQQFRTDAENLFQTYIVPPPLAGTKVGIYSAAGASVDVTQSADIQEALALGAVWINYVGHGGTTLWGNGITMPSQINNKLGKMSFLTDFSCSTARFAEPDVDCFAEEMIRDAQGAIAFEGMAGFGFSGTLAILREGVYKLVSTDSLRRFGEILTRAKYYLWERYGNSSANAALRSTLAQYSLLGDPAQRIQIPLSPDVAVDPGNVRILPDRPLDTDERALLSVRIENYGLASAGSMSVEVRQVQETRTRLDTVFTRPVPLRSDSVGVHLPTSKLPGEHQIHIRVRTQGDVRDNDTTNNDMDQSFFVYSSLLTAVRPLPFEEVGTGSVRIEVLNPSAAVAPGTLVEMDLDTVRTIDSGARRHTTAPMGELTTRFDFPAGTLSPGVWFWRARSTGSGAQSPWVEGVFTVTEQQNLASWSQADDASFQFSSANRIEYAGGARLDHPRIPVQITSGGHCNGGTAAVNIAGKEVLANVARDGYNVVAVDRHSGDVVGIVTPGAFWRGNAQAKANQIDSLVKAQPAGTYFAVAVMDEGSGPPDTMKLAMERVGSGLIRSVQFWDSWAISGKKGAPIGSVPEQIKHAMPHVVAPDGSWICNPDSPDSLRTPTVILDTLDIRTAAGTLNSPPVGPAARWDSLAVEVDTTTPGSRFLLDLVRIAGDGTQDTLTDILHRNERLSSLAEAGHYPYIVLHGRLFNSEGTNSPVLHSWRIWFGRPPALVTAPQAALLSADSVLEGTSVRVQTRIANLGGTLAESVLVRMSLMQGTTVHPVDSVTIAGLPPDSSVLVGFTVGTGGRVGQWLLLISVDPHQRYPSVHPANQVLSLPLLVVRDTTRPTYHISVDGGPLYDGDYVSARPSIRVEVFDNSPLTISDPSSVAIRVDDRRVQLGSWPDSLFEPGSGPMKAVATIRPLLATGEHTLSVEVHDASGNPADSAGAQLWFRTDERLRLINVVNYPNPFSQSTSFTFTLTGTQLPEELRMRIFTVTGRLVREFRVPRGQLRFGFNQIPWDGNDRDGDEIANGLYFYKISIMTEGGTEEVVQKLAKIR